MISVSIDLLLSHQIAAFWLMSFVARKHGQMPCIGHPRAAGHVRVQNQIRDDVRELPRGRNVDPFDEGHLAVAKRGGKRYGSKTSRYKG